MSRQTTDSRAVRITLVALALGFMALVLVLPLAAVFTEALRKGWGAYWEALKEPDAWAAIRLTLITAAVAVPLNLIFGVIDVVWICYAELIMVGMYAIWWLHTQQGWSLWLAMPTCVLFVGALGAALAAARRLPLLDKDLILEQLFDTLGVGDAAHRSRLLRNKPEDG